MIPATISKISLVFVIMFVALSAEAQYLSSRLKFSTGYTCHLLEVGEKVSPVHSLGFTSSLNLWQPRGNFSVAFVVPFTAGIHFRTKVLGSMFFFGDIPLMGEINYGHFATKDFRRSWGVFAGGGYTIQPAGTHWQYGACLSAGFRFWLLKQSFTLRYARFFSEDRRDYFSHRLTLELNLGRWIKKVRSKNNLSKFEKPFQ